jgi:mono/diheme cytochrome c family protein
MMTDPDMRNYGFAIAIAAFSLTLATALQAADIFNGQQVYELHCQSCHGADGRSMEPGVPDFSRGESLFTPDPDLVRELREGGGMHPAYRGLLSDDEMRDVLAYIRTLQR